MCTPDEKTNCEQYHIDMFLRVGHRRDELYNGYLDVRVLPPYPKGHKNQPMSEETKKKIGDANRGRQTWNKGGKNWWGDKLAKTRVDRYNYEIEATHVDGRVVKFTHVAAVSRGVGMKRECIKEALRKGHVTKVGWSFRKIEKHTDSGAL